MFAKQGTYNLKDWMMKDPRIKMNKGFTFVELLVAMALTVLLVAVIYGLFTTYNKTVLKQEQLTEMQQIARNGSDRIREYLMQIGRGVNVNGGQPMMIYAAPYQAMFNADIEPETITVGSWSDEWCRGKELPSGQTINLTESYNGSPSSTVFSYSTITGGWSSNAETYRIYIDPTQTNTGSGDFSGQSDLDRRLFLEINGNITTVSCPGDNNFLGVNSQLAYGIRWDDGSSPFEYPNGARQKPLFVYWGDWDFNHLTPDELWGDTSGNGELSAAEIVELLKPSGTWTTRSGKVYSNMRYGAIHLTASTDCSGRTVYNSEDTGSGDDACNGFLDEGEDLNNNLKLDRNLLDTQLHRVEINITTIGRFMDRTREAPEETTIQTSVDPRNLNIVRPRACGNDPVAPNFVVTGENCFGYLLQWDATTDDGRGENDTSYYKILRRKGGSTGGFSYNPIAIIPANAQGRDTADFTLFYSFQDNQFDEVDPDTGAVEDYDYILEVYDSCGQHDQTAEKSPAAITINLKPWKNLEPYFTAFSTPCYYKDAYGGGSITLEFPSIENLNGEDGVDSDYEWEYWIYRSNDFDATSETPGWIGEPIAKMPIYTTDAGCHDEYNCPVNMTWDDCCPDANEFAYPKLVRIDDVGPVSSKRWYLFRDHVTSSEGSRTGYGFAPTPRGGHMQNVFTDPTGNPDYSEKEKEYKYRIYALDPVTDCLTQDYIEVQSAYYDKNVNSSGMVTFKDTYRDIQSFTLEHDDEKNKYRQTRFTPPFWGNGAEVWNFDNQFIVGAAGTAIIDRSFRNSADVVIPSYMVYFKPSKSERCEDPEVPIEEYWIVRERYSGVPERDTNNDVIPGVFNNLKYTGQRLIFKYDEINEQYVGNTDYSFLDYPVLNSFLNPYKDTVTGNVTVYISEDTCSPVPGGICDYSRTDGVSVGDFNCWGYNEDPERTPSWVGCTDEEELLTRPDPNQAGYFFNNDKMEELLLMKDKYLFYGDPHPQGGLKNREFIYYYYVTPVAEHNAAEAQIGNAPTYSIGANYPMTANVLCPYDNPIPGPATFKQCNLVEHIELQWYWLNVERPMPDGAELIIHARKVGAVTWDEIWRSTSIPGSQLPIDPYEGHPYFPILHYKINAAGDNGGWEPGLEYEYQAELQVPLGNSDCPSYHNLGRATPGVPNVPLIEALPELCSDNLYEDDDPLIVRVRDTGPYCLIGGMIESPMTTPLDAVWFQVFREYRYPWWNQEGPDEGFVQDPAYENGSGTGRNYKMVNCTLVGHTPEAGSHVSIRCLQEEGATRIFTIQDNSEYFANREYRYTIRNLIDQDYPTNKDGITHANTGNEDACGFLCDTGSGISDNDEIDVAWAQLCNPGPNNGHGEFSVFHFNHTSLDDHLSPIHWCAGPASHHGWRHPAWALHDAYSSYFCNQPFATDCMEFCQSSLGGDICDWLDDPPWWAAWLGGLLDDLREALIDIFSSHTWYYMGDPSWHNYTTIFGYSESVGQYSQPLSSHNQGWGSLKSNQDTMGVLTGILNDLMERLFGGILQAVHNAHYWTWNWIGTDIGNLWPPIGEQCISDTTWNDTWANQIITYHTKATKKQGIWSDGSGFNSKIIFGFLMRDNDGASPVPNDIPVFVDPYGYMVVNDFGEPNKPNWWPWGSANEPDKLTQFLTIRTNWAMIHAWATGPCLTFNWPFGVDPVEACHWLDLFFTVPREWSWASVKSDWIKDGKDIDVDAHANLLFTCQQADPGPASGYGGDGISNMAIYFLTMHDPDWIHLNNEEDYDIEKILFRDALSDHVGGQYGFYNGLRFNSGEWNLGIVLHIELPDWMGGDINIELANFEADNVETKEGRIGWYFDTTTYMDWLDFKWTPTFAVDNLRIRQYCGKKKYHEFSGELEEADCPPQFLMDLDSQYGIFGGVTNANMAASGMDLPPEDPNNVFKNSGIRKRDISMDPLYVNLQTMKDDFEHSRAGQHPFSYRKRTDGKIDNIILVTGESLKHYYYWPEEKVFEFGKTIKKLDEAGLFPLTPEKIRYMETTGRMWGK